MVWSEQLYNTLPVYSQHLQDGSMQEETRSKQCSFCVLEDMKYFEYDNGSLNKRQGIDNIFSCMNELC